MKIVVPSSPLTIPRRRPTTAHTQKLAFRNPLHWLVLLEWILVEPNLLKAYKEQPEGEKRINQVIAWLFSTLIFLPLLLVFLMVKHWALVGACLLFWLLTGLLSMLSEFEDKKLFPITLGMAIFLAEIIAISVRAVVMDVVSVVEEVAFFATFFVAFSVASSMMWGAIEENEEDGALGFVAKGLGYFVMFFLSFLITMYVVSRVMGIPEGMGMWGTILALTFISLPLTIFVCYGELFFAESIMDNIKEGRPSWLGLVPCGVLAISLGVLLGCVVAA